MMHGIARKLQRAAGLAEKYPDPNHAGKQQFLMKPRPPPGLGLASRTDQTPSAFAWNNQNNARQQRTSTLRTGRRREYSRTPKSTRAFEARGAAGEEILGPISDHQSSNIT